MEVEEKARFFDSLQDVTTESVEWLKAGSTAKGYAVNNDRAIYYKTRRGVSKGCRCFVMPNGSIQWRTWSLSGNVNDGLTTEEARVFSPDLAAKRDKRREEYKQEKQAAAKAGRAVKVGDVFGGSYGYDATLYEFYEVLRVSESGRTVWVRELAHETAPGYGYNDWKCRPVPGSYARGSEVEKHLVQYDTWSKDARPYFKIASFLHVYLLDDVTEWHDADDYH